MTTADSVTAQQLSVSNDRAVRVLVLFGGQSSEHAVSCVTAAGVLQALDSQDYETVEVGITQQGQWVIGDNDPREYRFGGTETPQVHPSSRTVSLLPSLEPGAGGARVVEVDPQYPDRVRDLGTVDVVLPLLHGPFGEDGLIQGFCETFGLPYVGAGVLSSAVGMDKHFMKLAFEAAGLAVGPWVSITPRQWRTDSEAAKKKIHALGLPVFVKPARAGSSVGISRVDDWDALDGALAIAMEQDPKVVVEAGIEGREIECGVLDVISRGTPLASPLGEIVVHEGTAEHDFYDFDAKYLDKQASDLSCPAEIEPADTAEIQRQAVIAFEAVDGEGLARVDFFYTPEGKIVINEINTMPGFTSISMYPQMWAAEGWEFPELVNELVRLALHRPLGVR